MLNTEKILSISQTQKKWKLLSFQKRQKHIQHLAEVLRKHKEAYAKLITQEMHKPVSQSLAEIEKCILLTEFYATCKEITAPTYFQDKDLKVRITREPLGIILGIMPWNFPFWQALRFAIPTLLAGNAVILKHASNCLGSGDALQSAFEEAAFPKHLFLHEKCTHEEVEQLLALPEIQGVSLTGSDAAGRKIAALAGKHLKKAVLELGGNDAFIILDDADIEQACNQAILGRLQNCGQTCIAAKRWLIQENIYKETITQLLALLESYQPQEPFATETKYSGMARKDLADELEEQYQNAIHQGAKVLKDLKRVSDTEFLPGALLIPQHHPIADQEIFGPLALVMVGKTDEELLDIANRTRFGLGNAVFTQNETRALWFADRLESGTVSINQLTKSDPRFPFGGWKDSGFGLELSELAVLEFTQTKSLMMYGV